jgi:hypothetical protein
MLLYLITSKTLALLVYVFRGLECGFILFYLARHDFASLVWLGLVWLDLVGLAMFSLARFGLARFSLAMFGLARFGWFIWIWIGLI